MGIEFEDSQNINNNVKRTLYVGAKFGFSKPKMVNLLVNSKIVKSEEGATRLLLAIAAFFFLSSFVVFWINAGGLDKLIKSANRTNSPISNNLSKK